MNLIKLAYKNIDSNESYLAEAIDVCWEYINERYDVESVIAANKFLTMLAKYDNEVSGPVTVLPDSFTRECGLNW